MTLFLAIISISLYMVSSCSTQADCSYNGACIDNVCKCIPQFQGDFCNVFNFAPVDYNKGQGLRTIEDSGFQTSSWGGSILQADDGNFHMWAAEMTYSTGIKSWITNSRVIHAVAENPARPFDFERKDVVAPVFAHEPTVSRAPTGEYVLFYTSNFGSPPGSQCGLPCQCGNNGSSCLSCPNDQQCVNRSSPLSSWMTYAKSPSGPWSTPEPVPSPTRSDTNLACLIRSNSSLACLGRPDLGSLHADNWRNTSSYQWSPLKGDGISGEDPMVWLDETTDENGDYLEVIHAVTHGGGWSQPFGFHYTSTDGGYTWNNSDKTTHAYDNLIQVNNGPVDSVLLSRRERPHVVIDNKGDLIGLSNGVTEAWPCGLYNPPVPDLPPCKQPIPPGTTNPNCGPGSNGTRIYCPIDYCYTLFQPFIAA